MSKKNKHGNQNSGNSNNKFVIPEDAKKLAKLTYKKYKKEWKDQFDSKKDLKKGYFGQIIEYLPESIKLLITQGHREEVQETKAAIFDKLADPKFVAYLAKNIEKEDLEFENMVLLPTLIHEIVMAAVKQHLAEKAENPNAEPFDTNDLIDLNRIILKKKIKKFVKAGMDEGFALDVLSMIPNPKILQKSPRYHINNFFVQLYAGVDKTEVKFDKVMEIVFKDSEYVDQIIAFALLERKEKIANFSEKQRQLFNEITEYCFKTLEEMKKDSIEAVLKAYVDARKRDEAQNKDTNRRYYISSLPESDYPKITKVVARICENDESAKKYF